MQTQAPKVAILGHEEQTDLTLWVEDSERQAGCYVLGVQGVGKSSLLEYLIYQDICKGYSVIVLDPHGDLLSHVLSFNFPPARLKDIYYLDLQDVDYPFGVNVFSLHGQTAIAQAQAVDRILHVFEKCFPDTSRMLLEKYLGNIAPVFFANPNAGYGMTDIPRFLRDDQFRERLLQNARLAIREFWEDEYASMSPSTRRSETASLATRLNRFVRSPIVGNIMGQATTTIDFRRAIENKEILLINLPIKTLKDDASLIGTMLIAQLHAALFSFADTPPEKRPGFSLFVDEFEHFATADFAEMFTEGRKFGARVTVAHQFRGQIGSYLEQATLTAKTMVCFQATYEDAGRLARLFTSHATTVRVEDIPVDPLHYLVSHGHKDPTVSQFVTEYLQPLATFRASASQSFYMGSFLLTMNGVERGKMALNQLLYQCMREGRADLSIPPLVLLLLAGTYPGAYQRKLAYAVNYDHKHSTRADQRFTDMAYQIGRPDFLHNPQQVKAYLKRNKFGGEFVIQMLTLMRQTMEILAAKPLGEPTGDTTADTTLKLQSLGQRKAFVKIGSAVYQMRTMPTPPPVSDSEQSARKRDVLDRTRRKYCTPAHLVERQMLQRYGRATQEAVRPTQPHDQHAQIQHQADVTIGTAADEPTGSEPEPQAPYPHQEPGSTAAYQPFFEEEVDEDHM